ncbi:MAG: sigma-70 family RNA polymerase sigma factor [Planctomycetes bacterium]|nr:sigma-70 family RNA polymerase sigma factor [Planctomycetota bacterium]
MFEDRKILKKLRKGDKDALCLVYETHKDSLRTIACSMTQDTYAAEGILHDVFVTFAQRARQHHIRSSLRHYLIACVANRVRNEYRRKKIHTVDLDRAEPACSHSDGPDEQVMADE